MFAVNITMSDGSRVCSREPGTAREATDVLNFISIFFYWSLGRGGLWFIFQAVRKQESSQSLSDCQLGRCFSPLVVKICLLRLFFAVFYTLKSHAVTSSDDGMLVGFQCCACPSRLPSPSTPESSYRWEYLCFNTLSRDNAERGSRFWHRSSRLWKFALCARYCSARARGWEWDFNMDSSKHSIT